jgi:hypothetical protein
LQSGILHISGSLRAISELVSLLLAIVTLHLLLSFLGSLPSSFLHISSFLWAISEPVSLLLAVVTLHLLLSFLGSLPSGFLHISNFLWAISEPVSLSLAIVTLHLPLAAVSHCSLVGFRNTFPAVFLRSFLGVYCFLPCCLSALSLIKLIYRNLSLWDNWPFAGNNQSWKTCNVFARIRFALTDLVPVLAAINAKSFEAVSGYTC